MSTITTYYTQTSAIDQLVEKYGAYLQGLSTDEKHFMIAAIHEFIPYLRQSDLPTEEAMHDCMEHLDPEHEIEEGVWDALYSIRDERVSDLLGLVDALNAQLKEAYRRQR